MAKCRSLALPNFQASASSYVEWGELEAMVSQYQFRDNQLLSAVEFAHGLGVLNYYGDGGASGLGNYVFLQPQWLVDVMKRVVCTNKVQGKRLVLFN